MNPLCEQTIEELEIADGEVLIQRTRLINEKAALSSRLAELKAACTIRLQSKDYHRLQKERAQVIKQLTEKEAELSLLKEQRVEINTVLQVRKRQAGLFVPKDMRKLVEIRDRWHDYSMDSKNHQKAREVAWKISQELREVLKAQFQKEEE